MSLLTGTNYGEEVQKYARNQYVENMEDLYGDRLNKTRNVPGFEPIGDLSRLTERKIQEQLRNREATRSARSARVAATGENRNDLDPTVTDPGTIRAGGTRYLKDERKDEVRRQERRSDDLLLLQMDQNNRQSDRQFQLQMAQNDYNNRRLDMQDARAERRDRQAMIMQLMKGLAQMGQGIAI